jgi:hypothetical protein
MNLVIRSYRESDKKEVIELWQECGLVVPWNDPQCDIERKLSVQPELFLLQWLDMMDIVVGYII